MQVNVYKGFELLHEGAKPQEILPLMTQLFDWAKNSNINAIIKSCIVHFAIEYIHPFEDGNGRMGRLWQTVILHSWDKNFQWIPVETMVYQNQQGYYNVLNLADKQNNVAIFIQFMLDELQFSLDNIIASRRAKSKNKNVSVNVSINPANVSINVSIKNKVIQIIGQYPKIRVKDVAEMLSVNERTIYRCLKELKTAGKVKREGARKNGYWKIIDNEK
jgi:Fic family protein